MIAKQRAYVTKNHLGYWVGCIEYPDGVHAEVTNAKHDAGAALAIAERVAEQCNTLAERMESEKAALEKIANT